MTEQLQQEIARDLINLANKYNLTEAKLAITTNSHEDVTILWKNNTTEFVSVKLTQWNYLKV